MTQTIIQTSPEPEGQLVIVRDNYQLAFEYLDHVFCNEMEPEERMTWDLDNGYGILVNFYSEMIKMLPYDNLNRYRKLRLNHSQSLPPTYHNRHKMVWSIEYINNNH